MSVFSELDESKVVSIDVGSHEFKQNARAILSEWAKRPPFYVLSSARPQQVICGRHADVSEVFLDTERFSSEMPRGPGFEKFDKFMGVEVLPQLDGERHARLRRLLMAGFSPRQISQVQSRITEFIDRMLDKIEHRGSEFDGMADYASQLVVGALLTAMLNLDENQKAIFVAFHEILPRTTYTKPGEPFAPECQQAFSNAADLIHEMIAQRRAHPDNGLLSALISARDQGDKLTEKELFDQIFTICVGALSATGRAAGGALYTLYSHPDQLQELILEPKLIPAAVEECLRIAGNGYFTFSRIATRDTEVGGTKIFKDMVVRASPLAANYDPGVFPEPLRFDIHRNPKRVLTFGAGPHHCIGNVLARTAIVTAIARLLARFPEARLADPEFVPAYGGAVGELLLQSLPMRIH